MTALPTAAEIGFSLLHADPAFIVLDKRDGLLSVPGIGPEKADCLVARAARFFPGARIVHRLDRDTSGVIVLALDAASHRALSIQFQDRRTLKRYEAVVAGIPEKDSGEIDLPLRKDLDRPPRHLVDFEQGRPSVTRWRVLSRSVEATTARLELEPITGRSHQLRVHLTAIGHPIVGDPLYAPPEIAAAAPRMLLHATQLDFDHPLSGERLTFTAPPPF